MTFEAEIWILGSAAVLGIWSVASELKRISEQLGTIWKRMEHLGSLGTLHDINYAVEHISESLKTPEQRAAEDRAREEQAERTRRDREERRAKLLQTVERPEQ